MLDKYSWDYTYIGTYFLIFLSNNFVMTTIYSYYGCCITLLFAWHIAVQYTLKTASIASLRFSVLFEHSNSYEEKKTDFTATRKVSKLASHVHHRIHNELCVVYLRVPELLCLHPSVWILQICNAKPCTTFLLHEVHYVPSLQVKCIPELCYDSASLGVNLYSQRCPRQCIDVSFDG
jgi:hypothetical protein